ncbi:MAG: DUF3854 domain-containing protein, partial [Cyanobacteria bacterium J06588_4]
MPKDIIVESVWAKGFYAWVKDNAKIPIIITEGAKKASCLIEDGYVVLGLPGIWMGRRQPKDDYGNKTEQPYLIPQLEYFAQTDREFGFAFDNDKKASTRINVEKAIAAAGDLLIEAGCQASVITWDKESEKGLDDLVVAHGFERFERAFKDRIPLAEYKLNQYLARQDKAYQQNKAFTSGQTIEQQYVGVDLSQPNTAYFVKSGLGTGKTHRLIQQLQTEKDRGLIFAG